MLVGITLLPLHWHQALGFAGGSEARAGEPAYVARVVGQATSESLDMPGPGALACLSGQQLLASLPGSCWPAQSVIPHLPVDGLVPTPTLSLSLSVGLGWHSSQGR
jgi:hypothetical protein